MIKKHPLPKKKNKKNMLGAKIVKKRRKRKMRESFSGSLFLALREENEKLWDMLSQGDVLTHRRTTSSHPKSTGYVVLFAEDPQKNEHYGEHVWVLKTKLPKVSKDVIEFASEFYGVSKNEAEELVNPDDIVDSAGAWDDASFVSDLWQEMENGKIKETVGFRTYDGAVVIDPHSVKMDYYHDVDEDDEDDED